MNTRSTPLWLSFLSGVFVLAGLLEVYEISAGEPGGKTLKKDNLDLPVTASGSDQEAEEEAPEVVVLYGRVYESDLFVIAGTPVT